MFEIEQPEIFIKSGIIAGITKRNKKEFPPNGISISPAGVFNENDAITGREYLADFLKTKYPSIKKVVFQKQVHGDKIGIIDFNSSEGLGYEREIRDGMICSEKGIILCISLADCAGVLIFDPVKKVVSAIHSGWKGTSMNIAGKGIEILRKIGTDPIDLLVWISPSASGERYEVGYDVAKYFINTDSIIPLNPHLEEMEKKYLFDNKKQINNQLVSAGVKEENIEISNICTIKDEDHHSYRRDKDKSGRMGAFIGML